MSRPEDSLPPDLYYNDTASRSYTTSSRIQKIQAEMTHRALSLLGLHAPSLILDIGCGSGLSGEILTDPSSHPPGPHAIASAPVHGESGEVLRHEWVGLDISDSMLGIARFEREVDGDLMLGDMGQGLPFRPGTFDGAVSISAIQWLCSAPSNLDSEQPERRLKRFFNALYVCLRRGARAVCQFYPKDERQRAMIAKAAIAAGFGAGLLVDDEGTKNAKTYLVCSVGGGDITGVINGMGDVDVEDSRKGRQKGEGASGGAGVKAGRKMAYGKDAKGSKGWILRKKDQAERHGKIVKADSKYTGRKRRTKF